MEKAGAAGIKRQPVNGETYLYKTCTRKDTGGHSLLLLRAYLGAARRAANLNSLHSFNKQCQDIPKLASIHRTNLMKLCPLKQQDEMISINTENEKCYLELSKFLKIMI